MTIVVYALLRGPAFWTVSGRGWACWDSGAEPTMADARAAADLAASKTLPKRRAVGA